MSLKEGWFISSVSIHGVPPWTSSNTLAFIADHLKHQLKKTTSLPASVSKFCSYRDDHITKPRHIERKLRAVS